MFSEVTVALFASCLFVPVEHMNAPGLVTDQMTGRLRKCKKEESKSELSIRDASRTLSLRTVHHAT